MKYSPLFQQYLGCKNSAEVFQYFQKNLTDSITLWDYWVNWEKVLGNVRDFEIDLNTLNYLVGKSNIEDEFCYLLQKQPRLVQLIPILLATREASFEVLVNYVNGNLQYKKFDFRPKTRFTDQEIKDACEFASKTGLLTMFKNKSIKSVPDYVIGVEVGLDSNARKNRGGTTMEKIVEEILGSMCRQNGFDYITQATADSIYRRWGIRVQVDKSSRRFDFAIKNQQVLYLLETNFYGGGGSKLKATAGEYKSLFDFLSLQKHKFIWITDGLGWETTLRPLEETFNHIDYTLNLKMVMSGLLSEILKQKL